jgi:hypothetical protein
VSANGSGLLVIERILRDRQSIWRQIVDERDLGTLTVHMLASSAIALACYGAVLGAFNGVLMSLTSAVKLPLLFLTTLAICLPTLYLFNLVFGARLSVRQALALVMTAITVMSMLALAFAPISLFFLITAPNYSFFKLLNVAILTLSAVVGLRFLTGGMQTLNEHGLLSTPAPTAATASGTPEAAPSPNGDAAAVPAGTVAAQGAPAGSTAVVTAPAPAPAMAPVQVGMPRRYAQPATPAQRPASMTLLHIWILLFGFVGTQLAWTLRPFFGSPGEPFALFRNIEGNFYAEIFRTIAHLF